MKSKSLFSTLWQVTAQRWLLGIALLAWIPVGAQNFVRNPDFEEEIGPDNWTVEYAAVDYMPGGIAKANCPTNCGPNDFLVKGRTCIAHRNAGVPVSGTWDGGVGGSTDYWYKYGAMFVPNHTWGMHGYFRQVVTNLTPGASYSISAWMGHVGRTDKTDVYLEAIGGLGSRRTENVTALVFGSGNYVNWRSYGVTNTANNYGEIEVRLHMNKAFTINSWGYREIGVIFDHVAVVPAGQTEYMPPYKIVSLARTNQDVSLTWETVMNNRYRPQYATNISEPMSWYSVERGPRLDTNFFATGTSFTFKTNLLSMFASDPSFDTNGPLYFRVQSTSFKAP